MFSQKTSWLVYRIFNLAPSEISRVLQAWLLHFVYALAFFLGWTVLLALFVGHFSATYLPLLYLSYALFSVLGSLLYAPLLYHMEQKKLMGGTIGALLVCLGLAGWQHASPPIFFGLLLITFGVFIFQVGIFLSRHREELFSPLESQRVLPFIDTTEPLGGIAAGLLILWWIEKIHTENFLWILALLLILLLFIFMGISNKPAPGKSGKEHKPTRTILTFKRGWEHLRAISFMRDLAVVLLITVVVTNIVEVLYTRAIETVVLHGSNAHHIGLNELLSERLGFFQVLFSSLVLVMQLFLGSRLVQALGVVRSFLLMPLSTIGASLLTLLQGGGIVQVSSKGALETFGVVHKTAYHNAYYSIPENMREYIRQLLEGIIRPLGIVMGTIFIVVTQYFFHGQEHWYLNALLILLLGITVLLVQRFPKEYTAILKKNLAGSDPVLKNHAIQILSQKSSHEAAEILSKALLYRKEDPKIKCAILAALGHMQDPSSLPEIIQALEDPQEDVKVAACQALARFKNLGEQVYHQAFAKHKIITVLTHLLAQEKNPLLRSAIIAVFAAMRHNDIAALLLELLEKADAPETKADYIAIIGLFDDINIWSYLNSYLSHPHPRIRANTIVALWKFRKYRLQLLIHLLGLLESKDRNALLAGIWALGETCLSQESKRLERYLQASDITLVQQAAVALLKMNRKIAVTPLLKILLGEEELLARQTAVMVQSVHNSTARILRKALAIEMAQTPQTISSSSLAATERREKRLLWMCHEAYAPLRE